MDALEWTLHSAQPSRERVNLMRTGKDLAGLAIIDVRDGKKLGSADEVVISPDDGRLLGFVMKRGGLFSSDESMVEIEDVRAIGADAITVEGAEVAHTADASGEAFRGARGGNRSLVGRKVVTQGGSVAGQVADIVINEDQRRVTALLVGGGLLERDDAIPADRIVSVGPDVIIIRDDDADETSGPFSADRGIPATAGHSPLPGESVTDDHDATSEKPS